MKDAEPIDGIVGKVMKRLGLENQHWLAVLEGEWEAIVGASVAAHARPGRVERGRLTVFVDNSVWLSELSRYGRDKILENLQAKFGKGKIQSIGLQIDPDRGG